MQSVLPAVDAHGRTVGQPPLVNVFPSATTKVTDGAGILWGVGV
jgi:hypothetical protein